MNIKKNLRNILLSSCATLFTALSCLPSSFAVKKNWDKDSIKYN